MMPQATANTKHSGKNTIFAPAFNAKNRPAQVANINALPPPSAKRVEVRADMGPPSALGAMASARMMAGSNGSVEPKYCTAAGVESDWKNIPIPQAAI